MSLGVITTLPITHGAAGFTAWLPVSHLNISIEIIKTKTFYAGHALGQGGWHQTNLAKRNRNKLGNKLSRTIL